MNTGIVVYGGSFDPITGGHLEIISRAAWMFNKVIVVVCPNYAKPNSEFTPQERKKLIEESICDLDMRSKIEVDILPPATFLATYAKSKFAGTLIRGLRDNIDFNAEQKVGETNKAIYPAIETIYLMPSPDYAKVSSSWAKGLVGFHGWKEALSRYVSPIVVKSLETKWLERQIRETLSLCEKNGIIRRLKLEQSVSGIIKTYSERPYHNTTHIADMLLNLTYYVTNKQDLYGVNFDEISLLTLKLAIILHDIDPKEENCFDWPDDQDLFSFCDPATCGVCDLIMATKHSDISPSDSFTIYEQIIHDLDLLVLASDDYASSYARNVKAEYVPAKCSEVDFIKGRRQFLLDMGLRKQIFFTKHLAFLFEEKARVNMHEELCRLGDQPKETHN